MSCDWNGPNYCNCHENIDEWISVKDRLPEHFGRYLVYSPRFGIGTRQFNSSVFALRAFHTITYWMPLPKPPEEQTMPDITMCIPSEEKCKLKKSCWRYTAIASDYQSMSDFSKNLVNDRYICENYISDVGKHVEVRDARSNQRA